MTAHHGPKRVGPRLHCVDIAWQVQGRCVGSVVHSPPHTIAARALSAARTIKPLPMHFACVHALGVPHTHSAVCALCVGSCTLQPAHLAVHALILFFSMQFSTHSICDPIKSRPIMSVFGSATRVTRVTPTTWTSLPNTKNQRKCCPS